MPVYPPVGSSRGGRGGGVYFPDPPRIFTGASLTACRTARNTHFASAGNADELAQYQRDQYRAILLKPTSGDYVAETYLAGQQGQAYSASNWINRASATITDAMIDARIASPARAFGATGTFSDGRIPSSVARDSELAAAVANLRGGVEAAYDTLKELADARITGVSLSGGTLSLARPVGGAITVNLSGLSRTDAQINQLIQTALQAAVTGNTETRIAVTYSSGKYNFVVPEGVTLAQALAAIMAGDGIRVDRSTANQITISASGQVIPPSSGDSYCGTSEDSAITETEAQAGTSGESNALAIPAYSGARHVFFLRPAAQGAITTVYLYASGHRNTQNQRTAFTPITVTVGGASHVGVVSREALTGAGGRIMEVA